jgi:hypothetical protein
MEGDRKGVAPGRPFLATAPALQLYRTKKS